MLLVWLCLPQKGRGVDGGDARLHSLVGQEMPPLWGEAAMTPASIIGFIAVCILASVAGWAALRWVERKPPAP